MINHSSKYVFSVDPPAEPKPAVLAPKINKLPKTAFEVSEEDDLFEYNSLSNKLKRFGRALSYFFLPVAIGRLINRSIVHWGVKELILPKIKIAKAELDQKRAQFIESLKDKSQFERIAIRTADDIKLDTVLIHPAKAEGEEEKKEAPRKFILFFNGPANSYEDALPYLQEIAETTQCTVVSFNYRGVGYSKGFPEKLDDLIMDGEAIVQYLLKKEVSKDKILIQGYSLTGSVVGSRVAANHQESGDEINFCSDRSPISLVEWVKESRLQQQKKLDPRKKAHNLWISIKHKFKLFFIRRCNWDLNAQNFYEKINGYKFILYNAKNVSDFYHISLYKVMKEIEFKKGTEAKNLQRRVVRAERRADKYAAKLNDTEFKKPRIDESYKPNGAIGLKVAQEDPFSFAKDENAINFYKRNMNNILG